MQIHLITGTLDSNDNLDGWVITSAHAVIEGREDLPLRRDDRIALNGDVLRSQVYIGNVA